MLLEILITALVILLMVGHLRGAMLVSLLLPFAVLVTFILMKLFRVDANIVALSGIAIAIGTVVNMGIVLTENVLQKIRSESDNLPFSKRVAESVKEVAPAIFTAIMATIISSIPIFLLHPS